MMKDTARSGACVVICHNSCSYIMKIYVRRAETSGMTVRDIPDTSEMGPEVAKTTVRSFRVIEALNERGEAGVSALASELGMSKGTVHKHLSTLQEINYVVKEGSTYRLGLGFLGLGVRTRSRLSLYQFARGSLEELAEITGELASLVVPEQGYGVYVARVSTDDPGDLRFHEGDRVYLHATAGGKAILAHLPEAERQAILDARGLPMVTENTITDRDRLERELRHVRDTRLGLSRGELEPDRFSIAAPITNADGLAIGAVTISGPRDRLSERIQDKRGDPNLPNVLGSIAESIQQRLASQ